MGDDLKSWRRRIGVVTLAATCALMAGWIRSYSYGDLLIVPHNGFILTSAIGGIQWNWKYYTELPGPPVEWHAAPIAKVELEYLTPEYGFPTVSYWCIVLPLTLLSTWLLLSKPRNSPIEQVAPLKTNP